MVACDDYTTTETLLRPQPSGKRLHLLIRPFVGEVPTVDQNVALRESELLVLIMGVANNDESHEFARSAPRAVRHRCVSAPHKQRSNAARDKPDAECTVRPFP
eukprot:CAMPEP_0167813100 /NCGR_PEP_ID=MMETSP0112_2-20121227/1649_1 /TAXON_ID=91324 /ORGANISM="Lotharella globosa, Strain CCCM811" /LENGTH=102 /DNA_ID=CAMNT_0007712111 /DNA_START=623 /DNA_END=931 /DNA_ORIENTATION=+